MMVGNKITFYQILLLLCSIDYPVCTHKKYVYSNQLCRCHEHKAC